MSESDETMFEVNAGTFEFTHVYKIYNLGPGVLQKIDIVIHVPEVVTNGERWLGLGKFQVNNLYIIT